MLSSLSDTVVLLLRTSMASSSSSSSSLQYEDLCECLKEVLEICVHQILYSREVYPPSIFEARTYLGVR